MMCRTPVGGGKRRKEHRQERKTRMNEYVGIDIGGTKIEAVLVDERNTVLNK